MQSTNITVTFSKLPESQQEISQKISIGTSQKKKHRNRICTLRMASVIASLIVFQAIDD